jgi:hypothetical protein
VICGFRCFIDGMMSNTTTDINKKYLLGVELLRLFGDRVHLEPPRLTTVVGFLESMEVCVGFGVGLNPDEGWVWGVEGDLHWVVGWGCDILVFVLDEEVGEGDDCGGDVVEAGGSG